MLFFDILTLTRECFKTFSMYICNGFPVNILEFLSNPAKFEIMEVDKVVTEKNLAQELSTRLDSTMSVLPSTRFDSTTAGKEVTISLTSTVPGRRECCCYKHFKFKLKSSNIKNW